MNNLGKNVCRALLLILSCEDLNMNNTKSKIIQRCIWDKKFGVENVLKEIIVEKKTSLISVYLQSINRCQLENKSSIPYHSILQQYY